MKLEKKKNGESEIGKKDKTQTTINNTQFPIPKHQKKI